MQIKVASMQCFDKSLYMKTKDYFSPKLPTGLKPTQLRSRYLVDRKLPYIELQLVQDGILAKVEFEFYYVIRKDHVVSDIIYNPLKTILLQNADKKGAKIINGAGMLAYQGLISFKIFTGRDIDYRMYKNMVIETCS